MRSEFQTEGTQEEVLGHEEVNQMNERKISNVTHPHSVGSLCCELPTI